MESVLVSWSGGKDSMMALHEILGGGQHEVAALLTTVTEDYDRISMHGVRRELLERQVESLGFRSEKVFLPKSCSNEEYELRMGQTLARYAGRGVTSVVFGDVFLEDLRQHREKNLARLGMKGVFPIWRRDTTELLRCFVALGFGAVVTCVDTSLLDGNFAGRSIDAQFMAEFPDTADICGENGEYHSFVYQGPHFSQAVRFTVGETVLRDSRFNYCDLNPA